MLRLDIRYFEETVW